MTTLEAHRNLLNAAKLLLARFEFIVKREEGYGRGDLSDYKHIVRTSAAIEASKNEMEIAGDSRRKIHRI